MDVIKGMKKRPAVMFSSSASVYGIPEVIPIEESAKKNPISPYGSTKLTDEMILQDYGRAYGIDTVIFRYFNAAGGMPITYDLGQEPGATHIVARVLEASISGRAFTINGDDYNTKDGTCIRDYVHVWDIAQAHVRAAGYVDRMAPNDPAVVSRTAIQCVFNLGTNQGTSNKEIVDYVAEKYGLTFVNYGERRYGDPDILVADATLAVAELGWTPQFSKISTIIDSAYQWYTRNN
jgi:UDP-glucose 4-epimerase